MTAQELKQKIDLYYLYLNLQAERPDDIPDTEDAVEVAYSKLIDLLLELEDLELLIDHTEKEVI